MLYTFSAADPVVKFHLLQSYCLSLYGSALWKLSCLAIHSIEVSFSTTCSDTSGICHAIVMPGFYTLLLTCPVCLMLSFLGQHPFCHLPSPVLLWFFEKFLAIPACWHIPILGIIYVRWPTCQAVLPGGWSVCQSHPPPPIRVFGPSRTMILMRWLILFVLISALLFSVSL